MTNHATHYALYRWIVRANGKREWEMVNVWPPEAARRERENMRLDGYCTALAGCVIYASQQVYPGVWSPAHMRFETDKLLEYSGDAADFPRLLLADERSAKPVTTDPSERGASALKRILTRFFDQLEHNLGSFYR